MKKSKIKLLCNTVILFLIFYNLISFIIYNKTYKFNNNNIINKGYVYKKVSYDNYDILYINGKENIKAYICFDNNINVGDILYFRYDLKELNYNQIFDSFNYKNYLKGLKITKVVNIIDYKIIGKKKSYLLNKIFYKLVDCKKSKSYIYNFLFADKSYIEYDVKSSYSNNGIIHILCLSGFHVLFLINIIKNILRKFINKEDINNLILLLISFIYLKLTNFSMPLYRAILFYFVNYFNNRYKFDLNKYVIYLLILNICLFNNINYLYLSSFYYTFIIYLFLILNNDKSKFSVFIFLITIPLNIYFNYSFNILSIILNILFSKIICYLFYPLSIISIFASFIDCLFSKLIIIFEYINLLIEKINIFTVIISKINIVMLSILYIFIFLFIKYKNRMYLIAFALTVFIIRILIYFDSNFYIYFLDVGQGDMAVIINKYHKAVTIIDTGGIENNNYLKDNIKTFLHSRGITTINNLILTHGDYDHMGEAINLVNNFKVEKVIFNCGEFNDLEQDLIKELNKKKIPYYSCIKELNIDNNKLYFLQTKVYDNENDNSNVIYTEIGKYKFMFMGDAGIENEKDILDKYNISDIDVLKVGHHGSKTSSSEEFIDEINPKYSIISVGKNNRYGHPNKEVLNVLENSKIYRTNEDGSIMFKIKSNNLKIETCSP